MLQYVQYRGNLFCFSCSEDCPGQLYCKMYEYKYSFISVKLGELSAALQSFEKALEMAKLQNDDAAQAAIKKAIDEVNSKLADEASKGEKGEDGESFYNKVDYVLFLYLVKT